MSALVPPFVGEALAAIAKEREPLTARLAELDQAEAALRAIYRVDASPVAAAAPASGRRPTKPATASSAPKTRVAARQAAADEGLSDVAHGVLAVLVGATEPSRPGAVLEQLEKRRRKAIDPAAAITAKAQLVRHGFLEVTGTGRGARWSLTASGKTAAKEAP